MADNLGVQAYEGLFGKTPHKRVRVAYSGRFRGYNANVTSNATTTTFKLSKAFLEVGEDIQVGVMQHLLAKLHKSKKETLEMDLYNRFLKKIGEYETAGGGIIEDEELRASFARVNEKYFNNYMLAPHIRWGSHSRRQLGLYSFGEDTITLSTVLRGAGDLLDYVMYHELLHKKHKFDHKAGRTHSHTPAFRRDEKLFVMNDGSDPEKSLVHYLRLLTQKKSQKSVIRQLMDFF